VKSIRKNQIKGAGRPATQELSCLERIVLHLSHLPKNEWGSPYQGYFYRIIENEETESFELHRWPIGKPQKQGQAG
jgi:hypothetical protein